MDTTRHDGKVVIVTGAAGGIGAATALRFLAEGATVVASDITADALETFASAAGAGDRLGTHVTDVSSLASFEDLVETTVARFGKLDVLVNNAGIGVFGTVEEIDPADWQRVLDVDLNSVFFGARAALPHLRKTKGNIVNTASISGLGGNKSLSAYFAAKGGVVNFTRYLAVEHGHEGIRVNAVAPGPINSHPGGIMDEPDLVEQYARNIPSGRTGRSDEIAAVISFLASEEASYINGHNLVVDGGLTAWTGEPDLRPTMDRLSGK